VNGEVIQRKKMCCLHRRYWGNLVHYSYGRYETGLQFKFNRMQKP